MSVKRREAQLPAGDLDSPSNASLTRDILLARLSLCVCGCVQASVDLIRSSFKSLSLTCHPDKLKRVAANGTPSSKRKQQVAAEEARVRWSQIEEAHEVLSEPLARLMYDIEIGVVPDTPETQERIQRLKRKDAQRAVATMEETVASMRAFEEAQEGGGLLIVEARWGDLSVSEEDAAHRASAPYIDVTVPLQYHVDPDKHAFETLTGSSCTWLEGFYDPSLGANAGANKLYVKYKFQNAMHQAWFDEGEAVQIPLQEHLMDESAGEEGEQPAAAAAPAFVNVGRASKRFSAATPSAARGGPRASVAATATSRSTQLAAQKRRRRLLLYSVLAAAGVGIYLYRSGTLRNNIHIAQARTAAQAMAEAVRRFIEAQVSKAGALWGQHKPLNFGAIASGGSSSSAATANSPSASVVAGPVAVAPIYVAPSLPAQSVSAASQ